MFGPILAQICFRNIVLLIRFWFVLLSIRLDGNSVLYNQEQLPRSVAKMAAKLTGLQYKDLLRDLVV